MNHEVVWFGDSELAPAAVVDRRAAGHLYPLLDLASGRRAARLAGVDIVHFPGNTGWTRRGPIPSVLTIMDLIFLETKGVRGRNSRQLIGHRYMAWNIRRSVNVADAVVCPTATSARAVARELSVPEPRVLHLGIDRVAPDPADDDGAPYALALAAPDPRKGVELAIEGWRGGGRIPPRLKLLAGAGLPEGVEASLAEDIASGSVELLPYLPRPELMATVAGASALIYPSRAEGFGLPILEAMMLGVPVLSGLAPATAEIGGDAIWRIDEVDPIASIGTALNRLTSDPTFHGRLVEAGRRRAALFNWDRLVAQYEELYREVVDLRAGGR